MKGINCFLLLLESLFDWIIRLQIACFKIYCAKKKNVGKIHIELKVYIKIKVLQMDKLLYRVVMIIKKAKRTKRIELVVMVKSTFNRHSPSIYLHIVNSKWFIFLSVSNIDWYSCIKTFQIFNKWEVNKNVKFFYYIYESGSLKQHCELYRIYKHNYISHSILLAILAKQKNTNKKFADVCAEQTLRIVTLRVSSSKYLYTLTLTM